MPLSLEQGFPNLSRAPLTDTAFLNARRQQLRELEDARARERLASGAADLELVRAACDATDVTEWVKRAFKAGGIHTVGERDSPAMRSEDL